MQQACKGENPHQFFHDGVVTMPAMLALDPSRLKFDTWTTCCWWLGAQYTNVTSSGWALSLVQKRGKCWILEARRWINLYTYVLRWLCCSVVECVCENLFPTFTVTAFFWSLPRIFVSCHYGSAASMNHAWHYLHRCNVRTSDMWSNHR